MDGSWWSSSALAYVSSTDASASNLYFSTTDIVYGNNRWMGLSLRWMWAGQRGSSEIAGAISSRSRSVQKRK